MAITGTGTNLLLGVANFVSNTVSVMQSNGNGTFAPQKLVSVGTGPDDVMFADFNGDGIPDLVSANYTSGTVSLVLGMPVEPTRRLASSQLEITHMPPLLVTLTAMALPIWW